MSDASRVPQRAARNTFHLGVYSTPRSSSRSSHRETVLIQVVARAKTHPVVMASHAFASHHAGVAWRGGGTLMDNSRDKNNGRKFPAIIAGAMRRGEEASVDITTTDPVAVTTPIEVSASSSTVPRRGALLGAAGAAAAAFSAFVVAPAGPALAGNLFEAYAEGDLASKGKIFMGPIGLSFERLTKLQAKESTMSVEELAQALGGATLDCLNPRGSLAAYSNVRVVCTIKILRRSATVGPAVKNAPDSDEAVNVVAAEQKLLVRTTDTSDPDAFI